MILMRHGQLVYAYILNLCSIDWKGGSTISRIWQVPCGVWFEHEVRNDAENSARNKEKHGIMMPWFMADMMLSGKPLEIMSRNELEPLIENSIIMSQA